MSGVPVYTGPFGKEQAERLLWRAGFGARAGEALQLSKLGLQIDVYIAQYWGRLPIELLDELVRIRGTLWFAH